MSIYLTVDCLITKNYRNSLSTINFWFVTPFSDVCIASVTNSLRIIVFYILDIANGVLKIVHPCLTLQHTHRQAKLGKGGSIILKPCL